MQLVPDQVHEGSFEYRLRCGDETYRWVRDRYVIIFGSDEKPNARVGSIRDITAEKKDPEVESARPINAKFSKEHQLLDSLSNNQSSRNIKPIIVAIFSPEKICSRRP